MRISRLLCLGAGLLAVAAGAPTPARAVTVSIFCSDTGEDYDLCKHGLDAWTAKTGNEVKIVKTPSDWDQTLPLYQQLLSAHSTDVDVLLLDLIWLGALRSHLADLKPLIAKDTTSRYLPGLVETGTVKGQLVGLPWYMDTGVLYYRKDLLDKYGEKVPQTWAELTTTAAKIQAAERQAGNDKMWGYVWSGKAGEEMVCNVIEWFASSGGGTFIDKAGKVTVNSPTNVAALEMAKGWIGTISPEGVLTYDGEGARGVFQTGDSVFMRNWPYAWSLANADDSPVKGKVALMPLPEGVGKGARHIGADGTMFLGVSKYSQHTKEAADLVAFLTDKAQEKQFALEGSYVPTIPALFEDKEVTTALPFLGTAEESFANTVARPSRLTGPDWPRVSIEIQSKMHDALEGKTEPKEALAELATSLEAMKKRDKW